MSRTRWTAVLSTREKQILLLELLGLERKLIAVALGLEGIRDAVEGMQKKLGISVFEATVQYWLDRACEAESNPHWGESIMADSMGVGMVARLSGKDGEI